MRLPFEFETDFASALRSLPGSLGLVLMGMLLLDAAFILVSISQDIQGTRDNLHVSVDNGIAEHFQFAKWGLLAAVLSVVAVLRRAPAYFAWALLFLYFLIDDSQQIHERYGAVIVTALELKPMFGLRAQDFGELAVTVIAAIPLFGVLAATYLFAGHEASIFCHTMLLLVVALAFFGVGTDMLEIMVPWRWLQITLDIVEDGGEMNVATLMVGYTAGALLLRRVAPVFRWRT